MSKTSCLPTGWTQDSANPANVSTNGGKFTGTTGAIIHAQADENSLAGALIITENSVQQLFTVDMYGHVGVATSDPGYPAISIDHGGPVAIDSDMKRIANVADPDSDQDAATKAYVDQAIASALAALVP